ncbi:MAG TPA: Calx-beta domain-containing protein, partial [Gemmataceae bacterium]|nr:Calx-beta domain-containing protein [Gemmataceae bacterium]
DEQFFVNLTDPVNLRIGDGQGVGTILNDDVGDEPPPPPPPATLSINDVTKNEGNAGDTAFTFKVTRSDGNGTSSVKYATAYGSAVAGDLPAQSGTVTFGAGETEKDVTILVEGDTFKESDNTFFVNLTQVVNATVADGQGLGTIVNDDGGTTPPPTSKPSLSIDNVTKNEGNTGDTPFTFTVTRSSGTGASSVKYATAYGSAVAGDFPAQSGTVSFAAGQTSRQVTVLIEADRFKESDNTFFVNLTQPVNAVIGDGQGLGTIVNDD